MTTMNHAVIWDFDGTLVDTRDRNLSVARQIVRTMTGRAPDDFSALRSLSEFKAASMRARNWRDLYTREFGLSEEATDRAGSLWAGYQQADGTETPVIDGIGDVLRALDHLPHGIVSQNARAIIASILAASNLDGHFESIIGYEEVSMRAQKPAPDGLLQCIETLTAFRLDCVFYVGDHEADTECAIRARDELATRGVPGRVIAIAALYDGEDIDTWAVTPDHVARQADEVRQVVEHYTGA